MDPQQTTEQEETYAAELRKQEADAEKALEALPEEEKNKIQPILELQKQRDVIYLAYLEELRALENKYESQYQPLYQQRAEHIKHVPEFWLKVLKDNPMTSTFVYEQDEPLLKHLIDVRAIEDPVKENFKLEFEFTPNEFMENTVLSKELIVDDGDIEKTIGTEIQWKNNKNLTQQIKKTKKKGKKGKVNNVTKVVDCPSFFSFFKTRDGDEEIEDEGSDEEAMFNDPLGEDYELANEIRDEIVPNAALFYLNVRQHDEPSDEEGESKGVKIDASGAEKPECKQQ